MAENTSICINGELRPGDLILSTPEDDYACLVGRVLSINKIGSPEHARETNNDTDAVHVNFMEAEYSERRLQEIEQMLGDLYGRPTTPGVWSLDIDDIIMSPDALIRITGIGDDTLRAILDSREAAEALCKLVEIRPEAIYDAQPAEQESPVAEKLYSPLEFYLHNPREEEENGEYGIYDLYDERYQIPHEEALEHMDAIELAVRRDSDWMNPSSGLAEYVPDSISDIVMSLFPNIELHGDRLWCVADIRLTQPLTPGEMGELASWWQGQLSDGWGEGFEQRAIRVGREELYIVPWSSDDSFFIDTEKEFHRRLGIEPPAAAYASLPETPAQAALHEPDASENEKTGALRDQLIDRINANLTEYVYSLYEFCEVEVIGTSSEIAAMASAHYYLTEIHNFHTSELEYLLKFQNPLQVVADQFMTDGVDDRSDSMWRIFDRQDALEGDYKLMPAAPVPDTKRVAGEKSSVLEQIRQAREEAKINPEPRKKSHDRDAGPEL